MKKRVKESKLKVTADFNKHYAAYTEILAKFTPSLIFAAPHNAFHKPGSPRDPRDQPLEEYSEQIGGQDLMEVMVTKKLEKDFEDSLIHLHGHL